MSGNINFDGWINDDGSENYKCRAWVNFNGTGTVAIRASGNVTSITDNGTGYYRVNFTTAMPDANYSLSFAGHIVSSGTGPLASIDGISTSSATILCRNQSNTNVDLDIATFAVYR